MSEERTQRRQTTPRTKWIAALALLLVSLPANAAPTKCAVTLRSGGKLINASVYGGRVCIHNATDIVIRGNRIRPQARMPAL